MNRLIMDYTIEKFNSGIVSLVFKTKKPKITISKASEIHYWCEDEEGGELLQIEKFLMHPDNYLSYQRWDKYQVEYIFIPFKLLEE